MINLLPPDLKEQIRYAKLNRLVLRYLRVTVVVVVVLGGMFAGAYYLISNQSKAISADVSTKETSINSQKKVLIPKAQDASERLNAIKYIQDTQTRFSLLISDLVKVLPQGVRLESVNLTGDDKAPVALSVTADTYDEVLALRNSLVTSPRIANADLVTIQGDPTKTSWTGTLVLSFNPGKAK
jgi:Tfp pilus assembly protein PilN